MLRYSINRVLLAIPTLLGVAMLVFFMLRIVPGDIVEVKLRGDGGAVSDDEVIEDADYEVVDEAEEAKTS